MCKCKHSKYEVRLSRIAQNKVTRPLGHKKGRWSWVHCIFWIINTTYCWITGVSLHVVTEQAKGRFKIVFLGVDRDKSGRIGFFGSSGGTSGFGSPNRDCPDEIGTVGKYACVVLSTNGITTVVEYESSLSLRTGCCFPFLPRRCASSLSMNAAGYADSPSWIVLPA